MTLTANIINYEYSISYGHQLLFGQSSKTVLTVIGEATFTVAGRAVEPGVTATVFIMVVPETLRTAAADEGGIFCVAAAAAARAAMPLI